MGRDIQAINKDIRRRERQRDDYKTLAKAESLNCSDIEEQRRALLISVADKDSTATAKLAALTEELMQSEQRKRDSLDTAQQLDAAIAKLIEERSAAERELNRARLAQLAEAHVADFADIEKRVDELAEVFARCHARACEIETEKAAAGVQLPDLVPHGSKPSRDYAGLWLRIRLEGLNGQMANSPGWVREMWANDTLTSLIRQVLRPILPTKDDMAAAA